jgi:ubiquinone/menaquinone biosynthesis C-methylase UbiE
MKTMDRITTMEAAEVKAIMRDERWSLRHAKAYDRYRWLSNQSRWQHLLQRELASLPAGAEVVEVGCGTGFITEILVRCGYRVVATDLSPDMLEIAQRNLNARGLANRVQLSVGDAEALDLQSERARAVVSRWMLWTLPRPQLALAEMARILAPGGKMICIDGQHRQLGRWASWRSSLVDLLVARRLPGWQSPCYSKIKPHLPCLDGPEVVDILRAQKLVDVSFHRIPVAQSDGRLKDWLMGSGWRSYVVAAVKPKR